MSDAIRTAGPAETTVADPALASAPRALVPMQVGSAVVYVEQTRSAVEVRSDEIYPVGTPSPQQAFDAASEVLRECVRVVGERLETLTDNGPQEITVEFSVTFEVKGKASLIPVFVTAETGTHTGLKVTAKWKRPEVAPR